MNENFYINNWFVQPSLNKISLGEKHWKLEPKIMAVLATLAKKNGKVVSRETLLEKVWKDTVVVDMVITRAISELRSIFKDDSSNPSVIETIPKKGYRLIAPVILPNDDTQTEKQRINRIKYFLFAISFIGIITLIMIFSSKGDGPIKPEDYDMKTLTSLKGWEYNPNISPDGKSVVFVWKDENSNYNICTKSFEDESTKILISSKNMYFTPIWSKDKNIITYYKNKNGEVSINTIPTYGGKEEELIKCNAQLAGLSWSPDGSKLAFVDSDSTNKRSIIKLYNVNTKIVSALTSPSKIVWGDNTPRFSKDGRHIAYIRSVAEGNQDIFKINIENKKETKLTSLNSNVYGFDWKNKKTIILSSNFEGNTSIWEIDMNTKEMKKIQLGINNQNPIIQNNLLVFEQWTLDVDLWEADITDPVNVITKPIITSTKFDFNPSYSNNGNHIAFVSNRSGSYELWLSDKSGNNLKKITTINKSLLGNPKWSPDDRLIAFNSKNNGKSNIYFKNVTDKDIFSFTDTTTNDIGPSWSKNNNWLYYGSDKNNDWQIWRKSINNGGHMEQITLNGGYFAQESKDGNYLYYSKFKKSGIWKLDLIQKKEEKVIDSLAISDYANWKLISDGIFYVKRNIENMSSSEIKYYDFKNKNHTLILKTKKPIPSNDNAITISPDTKHILYGQTNGYDGDLIVVKNY